MCKNTYYNWHNLESDVSKLLRKQNKNHNLLTYLFSAGLRCLKVLHKHHHKSNSSNSKQCKGRTPSTGVLQPNKRILHEEHRQFIFKCGYEEKGHSTACTFCDCTILFSGKYWGTMNWFKLATLATREVHSSNCMAADVKFIVCHTCVGHFFFFMWFQIKNNGNKNCQIIV